MTVIDAKSAFMKKRKPPRAKRPQPKPADSKTARSFDIVALPVGRKKRWGMSLAESINMQCAEAEAIEARTGSVISPEEILKNISRNRRMRGHDDGDGGPPAA